MSEIEISKKTCTHCGSKCDLNILVCPSCTFLLPDGELPNYDFSAYILAPKTESGSVDSEVAIGKTVIFLVVFSAVIWLLVRSQAH